MTSWANSGTAIPVGMIWGWRVLSNSGPFADGQPATTPGLTKVVVLETDGDDDVGNSPDYTGYGYISDGKLGSSNLNVAESHMETRLTTLCTNMKNAGIIIFTIGLGDGATNSTLSGCAGPAGKGQFYAAPTAASLATAFQAIANSLATLYLSK